MIVTHSVMRDDLQYGVVLFDRIQRAWLVAGLFYPSPNEFYAANAAPDRWVFKTRAEAEVAAANLEMDLCAL